MVIQTPKRGIPLRAVVRNLNQTAAFSKTKTKQSGAHHPEFHRTSTSKLKTKEQVFEEEAREFEAKLPKVPRRELWLARLLGASFTFWTAYWFRKEGAVLLGLEKHHWEHPFGDTESEEDDDNWSDTESDDELDLKLEIYTNSEELKGNPYELKL